ncbi:MAG: ABZJ_00895 family protein [Pseudomonadota bacterium]
MAHQKPITVRFFWVMLLMIVGVTTLAAIYLGVTGIPADPAISILPPAAAAIDAGRQIALREGAALSQKHWLGYSVIFLAVNLITSVVVFVGAAASQGLFADILGGIDFGLLLPFMLLAIVGLFVVIRAMLWVGSRLAR